MAVLPRKDPSMATPGPMANNVWDQARQAAGAPEMAQPGNSVWDQARAAARKPAPQAEPDPSLPPVDESYVNQFRQNLASSRANVQRQYDAALAEINASEGRATQAVQQLPGMLQGIYGPAAAQIDADVAKTKAAQTATGLQSFATAGEGVEPVRAAMASSEASRKADIPLLQLGSQQTFATQRGGLEQARLQAEQDLADRQAEFDMQQKKDETDWLRQMYMADRQQKAQSERDQLMHQYDLENLGVKLGVQKKAEKQQAKQEGKAVLGQYTDTDSSAQRALAIRQYDPKQWKELKDRAQAYYRHNRRTYSSPSWWDAMTSGPGSDEYEAWVGGANVRTEHKTKDIIAQAEESNHPRLAAALRVLYGGRQK